MAYEQEPDWFSGGATAVATSEPEPDWFNEPSSAPAPSPAPFAPTNQLSAADIAFSLGQDQPGMESIAPPTSAEQIALDDLSQRPDPTYGGRFVASRPTPEFIDQYNQAQKFNVFEEPYQATPYEGKRWEELTPNEQLASARAQLEDQRKRGVIDTYQFNILLGEAIRQAQSPAELLQSRVEQEAADRQRILDEGHYVARTGNYLAEKSLPFASGAINAAKDIRAVIASRRIENGNWDNDDINTLASMIVDAQEAQQTSVTGGVRDIIAQMPAFMGELALTGGAFTGGRKAAELVAKKALRRYAQTVTGKAAVKTAGGVVGAAALSAANPIGTAGATARRMLSNDEALLEALPKGFAEATIEVGSEYAGTMLSKGAGKLIGKVPFANRASAAALKNGIMARWMARTGGRITDFNKRLADVGWNGVIGEGLEERFGDVLRMGTGLQSPYDNPVGQLLIAAPYEAVAGDVNKSLDLQKQAARQLMIEGAAFGLTGGLFAALNSKLKNNEPISRADLESAGIPSKGTTQKSRKETARQYIEQMRSMQERVDQSITQQEPINAPQQVQEQTGGQPEYQNIDEGRPAPSPGRGDLAQYSGQVQEEVPQEVVPAPGMSPVAITPEGKVSYEVSEQAQVAPQESQVSQEQGQGEEEGLLGERPPGQPAAAETPPAAERPAVAQEPPLPDWVTEDDGLYWEPPAELPQATPKEKANVRRIIKGMLGRNAISKDEADELRNLHPHEVQAMLAAARELSDASDQYMRELRNEFNALFGTTGQREADVQTYLTKDGKKRTRKVSAAGRKSAQSRMVERRGGDSTSIPGFDEKVQLVELGLYPNMAGYASSLGNGDMEAGLFAILQGGAKQFESTGVDSGFRDILDQYHAVKERESAGRAEDHATPQSGPAVQGSVTEGSAVDEGFALTNAPQPTPAEFQNTATQQPNLIPDLWRDALPGQQGLFESTPEETATLAAFDVGAATPGRQPTELEQRGIVGVENWYGLEPGTVRINDSSSAEAQEVADWYEKRFGLKVIYLDGVPDGYQGSRVPGVEGIVFVSSQAINLHRTLGHEAAHALGVDTIRTLAPELVDEYVQLRKRKASPQYLARMEADPDLAYREGVAELSGEFATNADFRTRIARQYGELYEALRKAMLKLLGKWTPKEAAKAEIIKAFRKEFRRTAANVAKNGAMELSESKPRQINTPAFKRWFKDSKVVAENGEPLVVYHGTDSPNDFTAFQSQRPTTVYRLNGQEIQKADSWDMGSDSTGMPEGYHYGAVSDALTMGATKALDYRLQEAERFKRPDGLYSPDTTRRLNDLRRLASGELNTSTEIRPNGNSPWFTPSPNYSYVRDVGQRAGGRVYPVYLSIKNPKWVNAAEIESAGYDFMVEKYKAEGYDGAIFANDPKDITKDGWSGSTQIVAFSPTQIKSATGNRGTFDPTSPDILLSEEQPRNRWHLKSADIIQEKMGAKGSPGEILKMLEKNGVKPEELEWMGLKEFLGPNSGKKSVAKDEVLQFLASGGVRVEEVLKGLAPDYQKRMARVDELSEIAFQNAWRAMVEAGIISRDTPESGNRFMLKPGTKYYQDGVGAGLGHLLDNYQRSLNEWSDATEDIPQAGESTKFSNWQLPGGENYRELLLTLPAPSWMYPGRRDAPSAAAAAQVYRSPHFDEPNILAHVRFNERTDADGKRVLFIEELQSDWHQEGKKKGYLEGPEKAPQWDKWTVEKGEGVGRGAIAGQSEWIIRNEDGVIAVTKFAKTAEDALQSAIQNSRDGWNEGRGRGLDKVPDAPFKKTWPLLAMKRAIQWASENGFDRVAWTTGEQQAERYDLSKQVDRIDTDRHSGTTDISVIKGNDVVLRREGVTDQELADLVGRELAEKIVNQKNRLGIYEGLDLKVGGEGMKGFYDEILVAETNKFIKKFGGEVGKARFDPTTRAERFAAATVSGAKELPGVFDAHGFDITPAMRESAIQHGQPLFSEEQPRNPNQQAKDLLAAVRESKSLSELRSRAEDILGRKVTDAQIRKAIEINRGQVQPELLREHETTPEVGGRKLANVAINKREREWLAEVDRIATESGEPGRVRNADVEAEADRRIAADYRGEFDAMVRRSEDGVLPNQLETAIAKKILNREAVAAHDSGDLDRLLELNLLRNAYRAPRTEIARALQMGYDPLGGKTVDKASPEERLAWLWESIEDRPPREQKQREKAKAAGNDEAVKKLDEKWKRRMANIESRLNAMGLTMDDLPKVARDPLETKRVRNQITAAAASWIDKLHEFRTSLGLLSGPATNMSNILGNLARGAWEYGFQAPTEAAFNSMLRKFGKGDPAARYLSELPYLWRGILPGIARGFQNALVTWKTEMPVTIRDGKWDRPNVAIGGMFGRIVRAPGYRSLAVEDEFFNSLFANIEVGGIAFRTGTIRGLRGAELQRYITQQTLDPESVSWKLAIKNAAVLTSNQELEGAARQILGVAHTIRQVPGMRWFIPFISFPIKAGATVTRMAPVTGDVAMLAAAYRNWRNGEHISDGMASRTVERFLAWGVFVMLAAMNDDEDPWITGTADVPQGRPKTSIKFPGSDTWFNYGRIDPLSTVLSLTVDEINLFKRGSADKMASGIIDIPVQQIASKTFLQGLSDVFSLLPIGKAGAQEPFLDKVAKWSGRFSESFVPNFYRQLIAAGREGVYESRTHGKGPASKAGVAFSHVADHIIPGRYNAKIDLWGRPFSRGGAPFWSAPLTDFAYRLVSPIYTQTDRPTNGDLIIAAWNRHNPDEPYSPDPPSPYQVVGGKRISLTPDEYEAFQIAAGREAMRLTQSLIAGDKPTRGDIEAVRTAFRNARSTVKEQMQSMWIRRLRSEGEMTQGSAPSRAKKPAANRYQNLYESKRNSTPSTK